MTNSERDWNGTCDQNDPAAATAGATNVWTLVNCFETSGREGLAEWVRVGMREGERWIQINEVVCRSTMPRKNIFAWFEMILTCLHNW